MPLTTQELSLILNPLVPESVQHNNRVSPFFLPSFLLCIPPLEKKKIANDMSDEDPLNTPLFNFVPPGPLGRNPLVTVKYGLRVLSGRDGVSVGSFSSIVDLSLLGGYLQLSSRKGKWCRGVFRG